MVLCSSFRTKDLFVLFMAIVIPLKDIEAGLFISYFFDILQPSMPPNTNETALSSFILPSIIPAGKDMSKESFDFQCAICL